MLHHILVKWNEQADSREVMLSRAAEAFAGAAEIPGVESCELIPSCSDRPNRYDLMIRMKMSPEGLKAYDGSPMHKAWKDNFSRFMESKAIFDCED